MVVAELALVAEVDDLADLPRRELGRLLFVPVNGCEERRKGRAKWQAAPAVLAPLENPRQFPVERLAIQELRLA
jgi:hypothetical protein